MPVVRVNDVWLDPIHLNKFQNGLAKEDVALGIIELTINSVSLKIIFIGNKNIFNAVLLVLEDARIDNTVAHHDPVG